MQVNRVRTPLVNLCGIACCVAGALFRAAPAQVRINEVQVDATEYLNVRSPDGTVRIGAAPVWFDSAFPVSGWSSGAAPFGFNVSGVTTDVEPEVRHITPSLYLRRTINVSATNAGKSEPLKITVGYEDGFVAYLNGREVLRANMGGVHMPASHDMTSFNDDTSTATTTYTIGPANSLLVSGNNVLAIQIHNNDLDDSRMYFQSRWWIDAATDVTLSGNATTWSWKAGTHAPSGGLPSEVADEAFDDFVELYNAGGASVNLSGWTLTDARDTPAKWTFPSVSIPAGGYLLVRCSGDTTAGPGLHANFQLKGDGEYVGLFNAGGTLVSEVDPNFRTVGAMLGYGWDNASASYRFHERVTPGRANTGPTFESVLPKPKFSLDPGFYDGAQTLSLNTSATNATIRYTTDGSEPTAGSGTLYGGPITLSASAAVRARTFKPGHHPSGTKSRTYLIDEPAVLRNNLAVVITGDDQQALFKPNGVTAVVNAQFYGDNSLYEPIDETSYTMGLLRGRAGERPISFEMLNPRDAGDWVQREAGLRLSGSNYTRPRYQLPDLSGLWNQSTHYKKPYFNAFFRDEYDEDAKLDHKWLSEKPSKNRFKKLRIRGGKNDWRSPFVIDEMMRRSFHHMGQPSSVGEIVTLWINGEYKAYFNPCERISDEFLQTHYDDTNDWDVVSHTLGTTGPEEGDLVEYNAFTSWVLATDFSVQANYEEMLTRVDMDNLIDWFLVCVYAGTKDWPHNNWYMSRRRTPDGVWRWHIWDAEASFGHWGQDPLTFDGFASEIFPGGHFNERIFQRLHSSPEFRLRFADRIRSHHFNDGALVEATQLARLDALEAQTAPLIQHLHSQSFDSEIRDWINVRRPVIFQQYTTHGLWPALAAPEFGQHGGAVAPGFQLTITAPGGGTIYYTTDGSDPRLIGGIISPGASAYGGPVTLDTSGPILARVKSGSAWSPLTEATFLLPPSDKIRITEIMYHPAVTPAEDDEDFEFIEIKKIGSGSLNLSGHRVSGIDYTFPPGASIGGNAFLVLASDAAAFASRYPGVTVFGEYDGKLQNSGERIAVLDPFDQVLCEIDYDDSGAWPELADGLGHSLVSTTANPPLPQDDPTQWRPSCAVDGSPGVDDPTSGTLPPQMYNHPDNAFQHEGEDARFRALAWGCPQVSYQWYRNSQPIAGATGPELVEVGVNAADLGNYYHCVASSALGSATSRTATLTILPAPLFNRADNCQIAYYPFVEGSGTTVNDHSGVGSPLNLYWSGGGVSWIPGRNGISVTASTVISHPAAATKIHDRVQAAGGACSIEIWCRPANLSQAGPARMVSFSKDTGYRNFTLGQEGASLDFRLRTTATGLNGTPSTAAAGAMSTAEEHYVATYDGTTVQLYRNGVLEVSNAPGGDFNWDPGYWLNLANEKTGDRPWLGDIHLVAIHDCALSAAQVQQNHNAGSDPGGGFIANEAPNFLPLSAQSVKTGQTSFFQVTAFDPEGGNVQYRLGPGAPDGASVNAGSGYVTWNVPASFPIGPGAFTLVAEDAGTPQMSAVLLVEYNVETGNAPPVLSPPGDQTISEGQAVSLTLAATDPDPGQSLTWTLILGPPGATLNAGTGAFHWQSGEADGGNTYTVNYKVADDGSPSAFTIGSFDIAVNEVNIPPVLAPIGDRSVDEQQTLGFTASASDADQPAATFSYSLQNAPAGATINAGSGAFSWTPTEAQGPGNHSFTIVVSDGMDTDSETITVTVHEVNRPPTLANPGTVSLDEASAWTLPGIGGDPDIPAQTLSFTLSGPPGASIEPTSGDIAWTPTEAQGPGSYTFEVSVDDGTLSANTAFSVNVDEVNQAPVVEPIPEQSTLEFVDLSFQVEASDADLPAQTLTYSLTGNSPSGAGISPSGLVTWTPGEGDAGSYTIRVRVSDGVATTQINVSVTVLAGNRDPVLDPVGDRSAVEMQPLSFTATASDPDPGQTLAFSLVGAPTGAGIDSASGVFAWTPAEAQGPGSYDFDIVVSDGITNDSESITVTVTEANRVPNVTDPGDQAIDEMVDWTLAIAAGDPDLPAQALSYALTAAPNGAAIDPASGVISWRPTETQGPGAYTFTVEVGDGALTGEASFQVTVAEVNRRPTLAAVDDATVTEFEELRFTATATDPDRPRQNLSFSLAPGAPDGAGIDAASGEFTWTPGELDGPGVHAVEVVVTDDGQPARSHSRLFEITVLESNSPPVLYVGDFPVCTNLVTAVPRGSEWRWRSELSAPPADWKEPGFDDSAWASGAAEIGYGDGTEVTAIPYVGTFTTYFRHQFQAAGAGEVTELRLALVRDDGIAVHLNGVELLRDNLPAGTIDHSTPATASVFGSGEYSYFDFVVPPGALQEGANTLAVEVHQVTADSNDMSFDCELILSRTGLCVEPLDPIVLQVGQSVSLQVNVYDTDLPQPTFAFSVVDAPADMTISQAGLLEWTADAAHEGQSLPVRVRVIDGPHTVELAVPIQVEGGVIIDEHMLLANQVQFPAQAGQTYVIEFKNQLSDLEWSVLGTVTAASNTVQLADPGAGGVPCRYYRVGVSP